MSGSSLYDDDILLWSEQQAAAIRALARSPGMVPNALDIENVAEEIESVGRSELAAVKSYIRQIFIHLIKFVADPGGDAAAHWRSEIVVFHSELLDRYAPSMRQRIDLNELWRSACDSAIIKNPDLADRLPKGAPIALDALIAERFDTASAEARMRETLSDETR